eukprot:PhF_6_TR42711/c0_g1_i1/m.64523/K18598/EML6; echinoderm microtubule-associated protein-like 6
MNFEKEIESLRAELLRQKIVFESELRRQRELHEEMQDETNRQLKAREVECRNLQTSLTTLGRRLETLERDVRQDNGSTVTTSSRKPIIIPEPSPSPQNHHTTGGPPPPRLSTQRPPSPSRVVSSSPSGPMGRVVAPRPSTISPIPRRAPSPTQSVSSAGRRSPVPSTPPRGLGGVTSDAAKVKSRPASPKPQEPMIPRVPPFLASDLVLPVQTKDVTPGPRGTDAPTQKLDLYRVFGVGSLSNTTTAPWIATTTSSSRVMYSAGAVCIQSDSEPSTSTPTNFYYGHTDSITCVAVHPGNADRTPGQLVATGQLGKKPHVSIWDTETNATLSTLRDFFENAVVALSFSQNGDYLCAVSGDAHHTLFVFFWNSKELCATVKVSTDPVVAMYHNPFDPRMLVTLTTHSLKFWETNFTGKPYSMKLSTKTGLLPPGQLTTRKAVGFRGLVFVDAKTTLVGSLEGALYLWKGSELSTVVEAVHPGGVTVLVDVPGTDVILSSGCDGNVHVWRRSVLAIDGVAFSPLRSLSVKEITSGSLYQCSSIAAMAATPIDNGMRMHIIGTTNAVLQVDLLLAGTEQSTKCVVLNQSHTKFSPITALTVHPTTSKFYLLSGNVVTMFDSQDGKILLAVHLSTVGTGLTVTPDGSQLLVAREPNIISVYNASTLAEERFYSDLLSDVTLLKIAPNQKYIALASRKETCVEVYDLLNSFQRVGRTKHSAEVTQLDWSADSEFFQTDDSGKHHLYFRQDCSRVVNPQQVCASCIFTPWTCKYGYNVQGIWEDNAGPNDVLAVTTSSQYPLCVVGDAQGNVKVFSYPVNVKTSSYRMYRGHSPKVSGCAFSFDGQMLFTTASDGCVFQWSVRPSTTTAPTISLLNKAVS